MFRNLLSCDHFCWVLHALSARAAAPFELKSVKIELPDSDRMFPTGPGRMRSITTASRVTQPIWC